MTNSMWPVAIVVILLVVVTVALVVGIKWYNRRKARLQSQKWPASNHSAHLYLTPLSSPSIYSKQHSEPDSKVSTLVETRRHAGVPSPAPAVSRSASKSTRHPSLKGLLRNPSRSASRKTKPTVVHFTNPSFDALHPLRRPRHTHSPPRLSLRLSTTSMLLPRDWALDDNGLYKRNSLRASLRNNLRSPFHVTKKLSKPSSSSTSTTTTTTTTTNSTTRSPRPISSRAPSTWSAGSTVLMIVPDAVFDIADLPAMHEYTPSSANSEIDLHLASLLNSTFKGHDLNLAKRCSSLSATSSRASTRRTLPSPSTLNCDKPLPSHPPLPFQVADNVRSHENLLPGPLGLSELTTVTSSASSSDHLTELLAKPLPDMNGQEVVTLPPQVHVVIHKYTPELDDELELHRGDKLIMHQLFNDGWCHAHLVLDESALATNTRPLEGICPRVCISSRPIAI